MASQKSSPAKEPNPITARKFRHEVFWQVSLPLVIGCVLLIILAGLSVSGATDHGRLADISLIWLIIPVMFIAVGGIALLGGLIYGLVKLESILPGYSRQVQDIFVLIRSTIAGIDDRLVQPFINLRVTSAKVGKLRRQLLRK